MLATKRTTRSAITTAALSAALACGAGLLSGCGGTGEVSPPASPVVEPGSAEFRKAQAQNEEMARKNQAAEARFRRRRPGLVTED